MKGYKRRQSHNGGRVQRIAANRERKRQERERLRKEGVEEANRVLRILDQHPNAFLEVPNGFTISKSTAKLILEKYLKDNGEDI